LVLRSELRILAIKGDAGREETRHGEPQDHGSHHSTPEIRRIKKMGGRNIKRFKESVHDPRRFSNLQE
jgi:hypothetical protein